MKWNFSSDTNFKQFYFLKTVYIWFQLDETISPSLSQIICHVIKKVNLAPHLMKMNLTLGIA
jgi:hypothetical protein